MTSEIIEIEYQDEESIRLDKYLSEQLNRSRSQIQNWIKEKLVTVNDQPVKANYRLQPEDLILVHVPQEQTEEVRPEKMPLDIVYEDQHLMVVNKPRGLVVHPAPGHLNGTLVNGLLAYTPHLSTLNGPLRPGIVHRIDKDTSGLLMVAKDDETHQSLAEQLNQRTVTRQYIAIVHGRPEHDRGTIDAPIGRDPKNRQKMAVIENGKPAITYFHVLQSFEKYSVLRCRLETGRTHQIRVHLRFIGHPVAGDPLYGRSHSLPIDGQALHAYQLGFRHPSTGEELLFEAPLPNDMLRLIQLLEGN